MAGMFHFSTDLTSIRKYKGKDGCSHYELNYEHGDFFNITQDTWGEIVRAGEKIGIPQDAWPVYASAIDIPIAQLSAQNAQLKEVVNMVTENQTESRVLQKIIDLVQSGNMVVYCRM